MTHLHVTSVVTRFSVTNDVTTAKVCFMSRGIAATIALLSPSVVCYECKNSFMQKEDLDNLAEDEDLDKEEEDEETI